jgi:hypothetical protein
VLTSECHCARRSCVWASANTHECVQTMLFINCWEIASLSLLTFGTTHVHYRTSVNRLYLRYHWHLQCCTASGPCNPRHRYMHILGLFVPGLAVLIRCGCSRWREQDRQTQQLAWCARSYVALTAQIVDIPLSYACWARPLCEQANGVHDLTGCGRLRAALCRLITTLS